MQPTIARLVITLAAFALTDPSARAAGPADPPVGQTLPAGLELPSDGRAFVLADLLRVRASLARTATVVVRVRIGTEVEVAEVRAVGERLWARVSLVDRPEPFAIEGWVAADLLTEVQPTMAALHHEVRQSSTLDERAVWVGRELAFDPYSAVARADLAALRAEQEAPSPGEPDTDLWIATCEGTRMLLAAHVDATGRITTAAIEGAALDALAHRAWYPIGESTPLPGTPFPTAFMVGMHGEENGTAYGAGDYPMGLDSGSVPVLGACHGAAVIGSRPTSPTRAEPWRGNIPDPHAGQLLRAESQAIAAGIAWVSHQLAVPYKLFDCGGEGEFIEAGIAMVTDPQGRIVLALGGPLPAEGGHGAPFATYEGLSWTDIGGGRLLGITSGRDGTSSGTSLVTLQGTGVIDVDHVTLGSWGC